MVRPFRSAKLLRLLDDQPHVRYTESRRFFATQTTQVEDIARISLRPGAIHISTTDPTAMSTR